MIHKVVTSLEFPYFAIPLKCIKKNEVGVRLGSESVRWTDRDPDKRRAKLHQD